MRYEILDGKKVINTILADEAFMKSQYPAGNYREVHDPIVPLPIPPISVLEFRNRFTQAEKVAIYSKAKSDVEVQIWLDDLNAYKEVNLEDRNISDGLHLLEKKGLLHKGRANEILGK